jgi:hypothetical protein
MSSIESSLLLPNQVEDFAARELARREQERRVAASHPAYLLQHVSMPDERVADDFRFHLFDEDSGWYWQREILDWWVDNPRTLVLKARQLGATWLAGGLGLWTCLFRPGSLVLIYRQKEADAGKIVERIWDMLHSLPQHLWNGARVINPTRGARPYNSIELQFPDGRISRIRGMSSTESAGHGETAALVIMDEFSRIDKAGELMKAVQPAAGATGKIIIVSTANGRSNELTGEGNYFHWLWVNSEAAGFETKFLPWRLHPDRDQEWYETNPEVRGLKSHERAEQYPDNEHEAFTLTNRVFFDEEALDYYRREGVSKPLYRADFVRESPTKAKLSKTPKGFLHVFEEPDKEHTYAIGVDVATGRGMDFSAAYVIDLSTMALVAEYHAKIDPDRFAYQLHFLGRWYHTAKIAVEQGGGFGYPVVVNLRDGKDGRPAYPNQYRHRVYGRTETPIRKDYGFPMNSKTRPQVINDLEKALRERLIPYVSDSLLHELESFVERDTLPSPRAQDGTNDDRVFAAAIALEMYRQYGSHPDRRRSKKPTRRHRHWLKLGNP